MSNFFSDLMTELNAKVVELLSLGGYPALTDGAVLFGRLHVDENSAPPRIVVVPKSINFTLDAWRSSFTQTSTSTERRTQNAQQPCATEETTIEVECWGQAATASDAGDFDMARSLAHAVVAAARLIAYGNVQVGKGRYVQRGELTRCGRTLVFELTFSTPVLYTLEAYSQTNLYAPSGVTAVTTDSMTAPDTGTTEQGC